MPICTRVRRLNRQGIGSIDWEWLGSPKEQKLDPTGMMNTFIHFWSLFLTAFVLSQSVFIAAAEKARPSVCLLIPSVPWAFGPYQSQGYKLSLELHARGFRVMWMSRIPQLALPELVFKDVHDMLQHTKTTQPPKGFDTSHLTFVGRGHKTYEKSGGLYQPPTIRVTSLNRYAKV
jgi:hypothetical protein